MGRGPFATPPPSLLGRSRVKSIPWLLHLWDMSRRNYVTFIPENVVKYFARDDNVLDIKNIFKCYEV